MRTFIYEYMYILFFHVCIATKWTKNKRATFGIQITRIRYNDYSHTNYNRNAPRQWLRGYCNWQRVWSRGTAAGVQSYEQRNGINLADNTEPRAERSCTGAGGRRVQRWRDALIKLAAVRAFAAQTTSTRLARAAVHIHTFTVGFWNEIKRKKFQRRDVSLITMVTPPRRGL